MTATLYLLDTDISSYIIKGKSADIEQKLIAALPDRICISAITRAELLYGLKRLPSDHLLQSTVNRFLDLIRILPWNENAADYYADIRHQLTTEGKVIGEMDMMIASHALAIGATLVSNNTRHFERIKAPLILENWAKA